MQDEEIQLEYVAVQTTVVAVVPVPVETTPLTFPEPVPQITYPSQQTHYTYNNSCDCCDCFCDMCGDCCSCFCSMCGNCCGFICDEICSCIGPICGCCGVLICIAIGIAILVAIFG